MILYGKIINKATNAPVAGATVTLQDVNGFDKAITVIADRNGYFFINSPIIFNTDKLFFTSAEYNSATVSAQDIAYDVAIYPSEGALITMIQKVQQLENVTVTATKKNNTPILLAGGLLLLAVAMDEKRKGQVSGFYNYYKGLPPMAKGAVVIGSGLIAYFTLRKLLKKPDPQVEEPKTAGEAVNDLAQSGIYPTHSDAEFEGYANSIVSAINDCGTDENAIYNVMKQMNNLADVYRLIQIFGIREYKGCFEAFFSTVERSLSAALSSELDSSEKNEVNRILQSKGITYQFT